MTTDDDDGQSDHRNMMLIIPRTYKLVLESNIDTSCAPDRSSRCRRNQTTLQILPFLRVPPESQSNTAAIGEPRREEDRHGRPWAAFRL